MPLDDIPGSGFQTRLRREISGEVLFDAFSQGRYATDASIYQIEPLGVAIPRNREDAAAAIAIAREEGVPVLPRGGGTSQCGQTVARALVIDCSKYLDRVISVDVDGRRARVEPGVVLDRLNRQLGKDKLLFPVDPSYAIVAKSSVEPALPPVTNTSAPSTLATTAVASSYSLPGPLYRRNHRVAPA